MTQIEFLIILFGIVARHESAIVAYREIIEEQNRVIAMMIQRQESME